jgi:hypothetical protein
LSGNAAAAAGDAHAQVAPGADDYVIIFFFAFVVVITNTAIDSAVVRVELF